MSAHNKLRKHLYSSVGPALLAAMSLATSDASWAACSGPGAPTTTQTKCVTAVAIPAAPANKTGGLQSFDISWVNPDRAEYYLGDRANAGITIVDTKHLTFKRTIGGFVGIKLNAAGTADQQQHLRAGRRYVSWPLALCRRWRQHAQGDRSQCADSQRYQADHLHRRHDAG